MTITVEWDNEAQTVLRYTFASPWTWEEYQMAIQQAWDMAGTVDHPTDTITDLSHSRLLPDNLFRNVRQSVVEIPESTRTVVLVGGGLIVEMMLGAMRRLYRSHTQKFFHARTVDEARALIRRRREEWGEG